MEELKLIIAKNIAELRRINGYTQFELAEKLNYSDKSISKWERGESVPDVIVLKEIADLFNVTLDYMVEEKHSTNNEPKHISGRKIYNRGFITGMAIFVVWLLATLCFVMFDITIANVKMHWLSFVYAVPVSMVVWLILNSIWFNKRRNFLIISLLMWTALGALFITFLPYGINIWEIFVVGIPSQIIIFFWSMIRSKNK